MLAHATLRVPPPSASAFHFFLSSVLFRWNRKAHLKTMGYMVKMPWIVRAFSLNFSVPALVVSATRSLGISLGVPTRREEVFASSSANVRRRDSQNSCQHFVNSNGGTETTCTRTTCRGEQVTGATDNFSWFNSWWGKIATA